ncbi:MAG: D-2-hydroxyacid dehydrogenase [Bacillaceae bacterium]|nr:D-2-hydroxyacid dehydrogenase [Bacillaceae bacterium]
MHIVSSAKLSERHQRALTEAYPDHQFSFFESMEQAEPVLPEAEVLITYGEDLDDMIIEKCNRLKWIQVISAGIDKMPMQAIEKKGILVTNARGIHRIPMAEYTIGVMLQVARKMNLFYDHQKQGEWDRSIRVEELYGKTVGILGTGAIGQEIARRAQCFGMKTLGLSRSGKPVDGFDEVVTNDQLYQLLPRCDYVVCIVPLTPETQNWIGEEAFKHMKETAIFINIARGAVVDEPALIQAIENGEIRFAVLDVMSEEPLPASSPLWKMENVILTPHVSGRSPMYIQRALDIFRENLEVYPDRQRMVNVIPEGKGY